MRRTGFLLFELLVVISLMAFLIVMSLPSSLYRNNDMVKSEIEQLFLTFSRLQRKAMATNQTIGLSCNPIRHSYSYETLEKKHFIHTFPPAVRFGILPHVSGPPASPRRPLKRPITFSQKSEACTVQFFPTGKISPGTIYLTDRNKRQLWALTCPIADVSYVRKYHYTLDGWKLC